MHRPPDIEDFITAKNRRDRFTNFNFSVALTDEFPKALGKDQDCRLINPRTGVPTNNESSRIAPRQRLERTYGLTERISTVCGRLYVTMAKEAATRPLQQGPSGSAAVAWPMRKAAASAINAAIPNAARMGAERRIRSYPYKWKALTSCTLSTIYVINGK